MLRRPQPAGSVTCVIADGQGAHREAFELLLWRRAMAQTYAEVRAESDPAAAHDHWRRRRDALFRGHPQSPLAADDPLRGSGLPYYAYDRELRVEAPVVAADTEVREVRTGTDGVVKMHRVGRAILPAPLRGGLDVWWLDQYAGGIFVPLRDATAGHTTYGGGRYLLDTAKGADLGGDTGLVLDLNFAYHPSCRYDPRWECPLAPAGNTLTWPVEAGERLAAG